MRRTAAGILSLILLLSLLPGLVYAEAAETVYLSTPEDFLYFAQSCAKERYSLGRSFVLRNDIDLSGLDCEPAGYFAGSFDGGGHSIRGVQIETDGSRQGLFRQIGPEGSVKNLNVSGTVCPGGSREYIGGIAGVNEGVIRGCSFSGDVHGITAVGGIVGLNSETGSVGECRFSGELSGEHQAGGIVGLNSGLVSDSENRGSVNTVLIVPEAEPRFDIAAFSQDDFLDISDIGGVAGENTGRLLNCGSSGAVGYKNTGYNVGGIAGKNSGFVNACRNSGSVNGRRDVGGAVGQLIPFAAWNFSREELDKLNSAVSYMHHLLNVANQNAEGSASSLRYQLQNMSTYTGQAMDSLLNMMQGSGIDAVISTGDISKLTPSAEDRSALGQALNNMTAQSSSLVSTVGDSVGVLAEDVKNISLQMGYILNLVMAVVNSNENRITQTDLSLSEAYEHDEGAVAECSSSGSVRGEANCGGLVGTIGFEVEFDMEDTLNASGALSTHAEQSLYAVVRAGRNEGAVQSGGDNAGGIVGKMDVGAVIDCSSTGSVASQSGSYVGGIGGSLKGPVCRCWSRSSLSGMAYVGGIAGLAEDLLNCRAWTHIEKGSEYLGAVAGWSEGMVSGNYYVEGRPDGVDGISRIGQAEALSAESFLALDGIPADFGTVTVRFMAGETTVQTLEIPFGGAVETIPVMENAGRATWVWENFDREHVYGDLVVNGDYYSPSSTIASQEAVPLFLAEGEFYDDQTLLVEDYRPAETDKNFVSGYTLTVNDYEGPLTVRMRSEGTVKLYRVGENGEREELSTETDGKYLVFTVENGSSVICERWREIPWRLLILIAAVLLEALLLLIRHRRKKRKAGRR
ncbi:MAG: hypothetical protein K6C08_08450 [Oscillospiraceae bacterium]|nr:hypothetical protein [Oscillospiraceae bacterium]